MNFKKLVTTATVITLLALLSSTGTRSHASGATARPDDILDIIERNKRAQELTGSWELDVVSTPGPGAPPPLKALVTFAEGGGCVETILLPPVVPAHGEWRKTGDRQYEFAVVHPYAF